MSSGGLRVSEERRPIYDSVVSGACGPKAEMLRGLVNDLVRRCESVAAILAATNEDTPEVNACALRAYREVETARRDALDMARDRALSDPHLASDFLRRYRRNAETVAMVESFVVPVVERFSREDRFLTRLTSKLADEVGWPCVRPVVMAFSSNYYWIFTGYNVIGVPAGEARTLLGLPDLCHELGHQLYQLFGPWLAKVFGAKVDEYTAAQIERALAEQQPATADALEKVRLRWMSSWHMEMICDMVATYLVGPAFGGQHVRLAAGRATGQAFSPGLGENAVHPADEARLRGIVTVLVMLGADQEAEQIRQAWADYLRMSGEVEPSQYALCYPQELIEDLARIVVETCRQGGIRSFAELTLVDDGSVQAAIVESWRRFLEDPIAHTDWEGERLRALEADLEILSPARETRADV